ncbi:hypothetical protein CKO12_10785 [Chromatium okenii]|nr:hypothetical protein [Chromatium okenii]
MIFPITAHRAGTAKRKLFQRQQPFTRQLQTAAHDHLCPVLAQLPDVLPLTKPSDETAVGRVASLNRGIQRVHPVTEHRAQRKCLLRQTPRILLRQPQRGDLAGAVDHAFRKRKRFTEQMRGVLGMTELRPEPQSALQRVPDWM